MNSISIIKYPLEKVETTFGTGYKCEDGTVVGGPDIELMVQMDEIQRKLSNK